jgi:hypothetical protein
MIQYRQTNKKKEKNGRSSQQQKIDNINREEKSIISINI